MAELEVLVRALPHYDDAGIPEEERAMRLMRVLDAWIALEPDDGERVHDHEL